MCLMASLWSSGEFLSVCYRGYHKRDFQKLFSDLHKIHIFECMGEIFCVEFQKVPVKFHIKYHTHTLKDMILDSIEIRRACRFKSYSTFLNGPLELNLQ